MKLTSIRLIANDIQQSVRFYEEILGLTAQWFTPDFAELSTSAITIAIGSTRTMQMFSDNPIIFGNMAPIIIEFLVKNVDHEYIRIKNSASKIIQEPTTMPWGNRSLLFCDPDGNMLNFFTPLSPEAIKKFGVEATN
ncbi:VOC family protein [Sphingobacterium siyangense subsp. cladoniae]|uniref:VOC family protein n=1 Tax=Sphingobacterium siyangense TaxID=459529 RepID=UPI0031F8E825